MMLIFFIGTIVAQFVGGARLFESVTGYSLSLIHILRRKVLNLISLKISSFLIQTDFLLSYFILIVFSFSFKVSFSKSTSWTTFRSFSTIMYMSALSAHPFSFSLIFEYKVFLNISKKF